MNDPITPFGRRWEIRHSLWVGWVFVPMALTAFISFLYIGARADQKKWQTAGWTYLALLIFLFYLINHYEEGQIMLDLSIGGVLSLWIASCIHAFLARRKYLRIIAQRVIDDPYIQTPPIKVRTIYPFDFGDGNKIEQAPMSIKQIKKKAKHLPIEDQEKPFMLKINKASLREIASHPYIGNVVARQIVQVRERVGEFKSFSHFVKETNIQPHILAKAKPYLIFDDEQRQMKTTKQKPTETNKKKKYRSGRIVDY